MKTNQQSMLSAPRKPVIDPTRLKLPIQPRSPIYGFKLPRLIKIKIIEPAHKKIKEMGIVKLLAIIIVSFFAVGASVYLLF